MKTSIWLVFFSNSERQLNLCTGIYWLVSLQGNFPIGSMSLNSFKAWIQKCLLLGPCDLQIIYIFHFLQRNVYVKVPKIGNNTQSQAVYSQLLVEVMVLSTGSVSRCTRAKTACGVWLWTLFTETMGLGCDRAS